MRYVLRAIVESDNLKNLKQVEKKIVELEKNFPKDEYLEIDITDTDTGTKIYE